MNPSLERDRRLIDTIVYLASLVSNQRDVDPLLDGMRVITASAKPDAPLADQDRSTLQKIRDQLESYLINRDPIRTFTKESLELRTQEYFSPHKPHVLKGFFVILTAAVLIYLAVVPLLPSNLSIASRALLGVPLLLAALHIGVMWLFMSSLRDFKPELRKAFLYISIGLAAALFSGMLYPVLFTYPDLFNLAVFRYGGFVPFFFVMVFFFYLGIRLLAKLLGSRSWLISPGLYLSLQGVIALVIVFLPHAYVADEPFFDLSVLSFALSATITVGTLVLTIYSIRKLTGMYARAMVWFAAALGDIIIASVIFALAVFMTGAMSATQLSLAAAPFGPSELFLLISGYVFRKSALVSKPKPQ